MRWVLAAGLGLILLAVGAGPASAARLKPSWKYVANTSGVLVGSRYVFVDSPPAADGSGMPGGSLIDGQTGRETKVVPPVPSGYLCGAGAAAIGGPWVAFECWVPSQTSQPVVFRIELYRMATRRWRSVQDQAGQDPLLGVGADWIEYWVPEPNSAVQQFVFENVYTGRTRALAGWQPGGRIVPDLNSPSLGQSLCAPLRVLNAWEANGEDFPGTVSRFGPYAVVAGTNRKQQAAGYLERCGTPLHRQIGPFGRLGDGYASANAHAVVWQQTPGSDLRGAYLPGLQKFTIDTTNLVNAVVSPYTGQNTYLSWLTPRTLYVLVQPYYPTDCTPTPCNAPPSKLYMAPSPRAPQQPQRR